MNTAPCLGNNAYQAHVITSLNHISLQVGDHNWFCHLRTIADDCFSVSSDSVTLT